VGQPRPGQADGDRKDAAKRKFDRWAGRYERDWRSRFNAKPQQEALAALELRSGDRFLDVGCGGGAAVRAAAATAERAVGVDISPEMIRRAHALAEGLPNVEFVLGDSEALPFADASFTALLCTASFHHYPNPRQAVAEMARVLETDGRLVIADGAADLLTARIADAILRRLDRSHIRLYRSDELAAFLRDAGFCYPSVRTLYGGGYAVVSARLPPSSSTSASAGPKPGPPPSG
jgi:ubiquinone/menaquinone biosynthesis C-methylase UbiE